MLGQNMQADQWTRPVLLSHRATLHRRVRTDGPDNLQLEFERALIRLEDIQERLSNLQEDRRLDQLSPDQRENAQQCLDNFQELIDGYCNELNDIVDEIERELNRQSRPRLQIRP